MATLTGHFVCGTVLKTCDGAGCIPVNNSAWREDAEGYSIGGTIEVRTLGQNCTNPTPVVLLPASSYTEVLQALEAQSSMSSELVVFAILAVIYFLGVAVGLRAIQPRTGGLES